MRAMSFNSSKSNRTVEEYDRAPTLWWDDNNSRPFRLSGGAVYELPFGEGKPMLKDGGVLAAIAGGWQTGGTFEYQPGSLIVFNTNLFYYGDIADIKKGNPEIALNADGTLDATKYWFNVENFERDSAKTPTSFQTRAFPFLIDGLRGPGLTLRQRELRANFRIGEPAHVPGARRHPEPAQLRRLQQPDHRPGEHQLREGDHGGRLRRRHALLQLRGEVHVLGTSRLRPTAAF